MTEPRVVFFGDSNGVFSNRFFHALARAPCAITAVVDMPPESWTSTNKAALTIAPFRDAAAERRIPVFDSEDPNDPGLVRELAGMEPDLLVAVGYARILKPSLLAVPRLAPVNFHASLLPAYRGKHPVFWALRHGEKSAGLTVHIMDPHLDTGDILYQVRVRTRRRDTVASLYSRIMDRSVSLMGRLVSQAAAGRLRPRPQPEAGASYYSSIQEEDFRLDWTRDAEPLRRWVCTSPGQCFFTVGGERIYVMDAETGRRADPAGSAPPGTLVRLGREHATVAAGSGALRIGQVRLGESELGMAVLCHRLGLAQGDALSG